MKPGVLICAVLGHRWHVDETTTDTVEPLLCCGRCGRRSLAPNATGYGVRTKVKAGAYGSFLKK